MEELCMALRMPRSSQVATITTIGCAVGLAQKMTFLVCRTIPDAAEVRADDDFHTPSNTKSSWHTIL